MSALNRVPSYGHNPLIEPCCCIWPGKADLVNKKNQNKEGPPLPSPEQILEFIQSSPQKVGKREIARAFHIKGGQRIALKRLLKQMAEDGLIEGRSKALRQPGTLGKVTVVEIVGRDEYGDFYGHPARWDVGEDGPLPKILIGETKGKRGALPGLGDRVLAHIDRQDLDQTGYLYAARPIKVLPRNERRLLGIYHAHAEGGEIQPIDKKSLKSWTVKNADRLDAQEGELVSFEIMSKGRFSRPRARIVERLGNPQSEGLTSLIAIETHGIPHDFPQTVLDELDRLPALSKKGREDLRDLPLVTIDPPDARDHDDAVWASPDKDPKNPEGWVVVVAIADVAFYVRPGSLLDQEALKRGNSVYFPDRVVPMLPEKISNDLCSLKEGVDRPALAVQMVFNKDGKKISHQFKRILMKSAAKLSYAQAQAAIDGHPDDKTRPLLEPVLTPLWAAYRALSKARDKRSPLALDLPERKILMSDAGKIKDIIVPERLTAHKLIEEFMIQANVAAAESLVKKSIPLLFRVHDTPSDEKIQSLKEFLSTLNLKFGGSGPIAPKLFNGILAQAEGKPYQEMVTEVVLRSQAQAEYGPENYGHFGLNLARYAHFTSPIRRYADLIVHRGLIHGFQFGDDGLDLAIADELADIGAQISDTERRAMLAERETLDRLIALYLEKHEGAEFKGRISGVTRAGLFVRLDDTGADGFIPISTLGKDYFVHDEVAHALIGERSHLRYHIGQRVDVRLVEIVPTAGALRFEMLSEGVEGAPPDRSHRAPSRRGRPGKGRKSSTRAKPVSKAKKPKRSGRGRKKR